MNQANGFDLINTIRQRTQQLASKMLHSRGLSSTTPVEGGFSCYCNIPNYPKALLESLAHANVKTIHVADRKVGAADRSLWRDLDQIERIYGSHSHTTLVIIVLITGDIDFIGKINDLRHQAGFQVILIHNDLAKRELRESASVSVPWKQYFNSSSPSSIASHNRPRDNNQGPLHE